MISSYSISEIKKLPQVSGVYTFLGPEDEPLYIGKSKNIRTRIHSHFSHYRRTHERDRLYSQIHSIQIEETAGDISASLLELIRIKEILPLYNRRARYAKEFAYTYIQQNAKGYKEIHIKRGDIPEKFLTSIVGVFRSVRQAKEFLSSKAYEHVLCKKLLSLEGGQGSCFGIHIGTCHGVCNGGEDIEIYNNRLEDAFSKERIQTWPFNGTYTVKEISLHKDFRDEWEIYNWVLKRARRIYTKHTEHEILSEQRAFDIDMYGILANSLC